MFRWIKFLFFSENKNTYRTIAEELNASTYRVYCLAHGKKAKSNKDYQVLKRLQREEIIEGVNRML